MVSPVSLLMADAKATVHRPLIVELMGLAGAGKTSTAADLHQLGGGIARGDFPDVHKLRSAQFFVVNGIVLTPLLLRLRRENGLRLTRRQAAWMMILTGWPALLQRAPSNDTSVIIVDQGALYMLAELRSYGPECLKGRTAAEWWVTMYCRWARTLDLVIWLDAPDAILMQRIRKRHCGHWAEDKPDDQVVQFLSRFRAGYEHVIGEMAANNGELLVVRIDTACAPKDEVVAQVLSLCGLQANGQRI